MKSAGTVHKLWILSNRIESNKICTMRNFRYIIHWLTYIKSAAFDKISMNMTFVCQFECCLNSQHLSIVCPCANNSELFGFEQFKTWFISNTNTIAGLFGFFYGEKSLLCSKFDNDFWLINFTFLVELQLNTTLIHVMKDSFATIMEGYLAPNLHISPNSNTSSRMVNTKHFIKIHEQILSFALC